MLISEIKLITPSLAREILTRNTHNRNIKVQKVEQFKQDIISGNWQNTHQGIAIYDDGTLCDGQHRLEAIAQSGFDVQMIVTTGVSKQAGAYVDAGTARTEHDRLKIAGCEKWVSTITLAALKMIYYQSKISYSTKVLNEMAFNSKSILKPIIDSKKGTKITAPQIAAFYLAVHHSKRFDEIMSLVDIFVGKKTPSNDVDFNMCKLALTMTQKRFKTRGSGERILVMNVMQQAIKRTLDGKVVTSFRNTNELTYPTLKPPTIFK